MRQYIKLSKREADGLTIYCAIYYGTDGQYCGDICNPFESEAAFLEGVETVCNYYGFHNYEIASDIISILQHYRGMPGITVHYKLEMPEMDDFVKQELPLLKELHEFPTLTPKSSPSRFNAWIHGHIKNLITKLEGKYDYERN
ncbi:hypothetical protein CN514_07870 [Bacillus sp. AFS001701]|uniref:hypothetical protein n=1 Tax=Bacillus sp. AFS001701 TaxID=2033480 RepID=UPI000BF7B0EA|nr:hypothetical protein [Bacillus sp. AFS001701]PET70085.1 hypothetical protein CN514_07870 [Bacillus sp. AFS001701]